jgi:hypothetical protein
MKNEGQQIRLLLLELIFTFIPDFDLAGAVQAFGNVSFEIYVTHRMIIYLNGQSSNTGLRRRAFGHGPTLQYALHFQPEIIVQATGMVFLDDKSTHFDYQSIIQSQDQGKVATQRGFAASCRPFMPDKSSKLPTAVQSCRQARFNLLQGAQRQRLQRTDSDSLGEERISRVSIASGWL